MATTTATKPTIILVPGSFSTIAVVQPLVDRARAIGREIVTLQLPSAGRKPGPPPGLRDDVEAVRALTMPLLEEGKDVVAVGCSYGGKVVAQAMVGLGKKERAAAGKKGGVVRVGYALTAVPEVGKSSVDDDSGAEAQQAMYGMKIEDGWLSFTSEALGKIAFADSSLGEALRLSQGLTEQSLAAYVAPLEGAAYVTIPSSWFVTERDLAVPPASQMKSIAHVEKVSGMKVDVTRIEAGHGAYATHPKEFVDWMAGLEA